MMKLKTIGLGLALLFGAQSAFAAAQPNVLLITIDDMNDWTGFLGGHPQAQTPHMDRLAERGINFSNAHCAAPGCSPSRNSLLYGVEPFNSGLYAFYDQDQFSDLVLKNYVSLPQFFKENGYNTYGVGKNHHRREPTPVEWTEYSKGVGESKALQFDTAAGYRIGSSKKMNFSPTLNPLEEHPDYRRASFGIEVLEREHDKPFFLAVGIVRPHLPFVAPKQFFDLYPEEVEAPSLKVNDLDDIPPVGRSMARINNDRQFKRAKAWGKVRRAYLACISWADHNVGRLLEALEKSAYADNTIIVLWSDHGFALGEKQHFTKFALWEETTRVPFIILDPRMGKKQGHEVKDAVSVINVYRTLAELTGLKAPDYVDGISLVPVLKDPEALRDTPSICSWGRGNYTLRDREWRYTRYFDGTEELYNHKSDSNEWNNLAENPEYAAVKKKLAQHFPQKEAPLVLEGIEAWSLPVSADKSLKGKGKKGDGKPSVEKDGEKKASRKAAKKAARKKRKSGE